MLRKFFLVFLLAGHSSVIIQAQTSLSSSDLFKRPEHNNPAGKLNIYHAPALDTLISRYILSFRNLEEKNGLPGMEGYRIQIYSSSVRDAREESGKVRAEFMSKFPDVISYLKFAEPGYYKIRVGDFRTKTQATRLFLTISKVFPNAYIVPDIINFPDQNKK